MNVGTLTCVFAIALVKSTASRKMIALTMIFLFLIKLHLLRNTENGFCLSDLSARVVVEIGNRGLRNLEAFCYFFLDQTLFYEFKDLDFLLCKHSSTHSISIITYTTLIFSIVFMHFIDNINCSYTISDTAYI